MIDLHTHTLASDGRCTPAELVARAHAAGIRVLSVTDHDTMAACDEAEQSSAAAGLAFVPGIEVTAIVGEMDVHVLGYFVNRGYPPFIAFLEEQRRSRIARVREMVDRLALHGIVLDADAILQPCLDNPGKAAGRPWIARALVAGGHVASTNDAFATWLQRGRPAFVPRPGPDPAQVIANIHEAGGVASMAHPGLVGHDEWIPGFAASGLDALEAYHSQHTKDTTSRYLTMAGRLKLAVSGGSDYHADESPGAARLGSASLPPDAFELLRGRRATTRATASGDVTSS